MRYSIIVPNLSLFDGAAAGAGEGAAAAGAESAPNGKAAEPKVIYGKQAGAPAAEPQAEAKQDGAEAETPEARRARYRELVNGEFKDLYTEDTQRMIDRRFKTAKENEQAIEKLRGIADRLATRYGVDAADADAITAALDADNDMWQSAADEAGMSVEQFKAMKKLERDNAALVAAENARKSEEATRATLAKWGEEEAALRERIPGFDLRTEAQNPQFVSMLRSFTDNGFDKPMERAFKSIHMDEIMNGAIQKTQAVTEQRVIANVRAKGSRPAEAGLGSQSGVVVKDDVTKLTKSDRADIARRAMRGERITF